VPHIVAYKVPKLTEWIAKRVLHIQFVNLTNILLGYEVVPELLQTDCNPENILQYVEQFLSQNTLYKRQIENFEKLRKLLGMGVQTPSDNAAAAIIKRIKHRK
jgi:lipid-A-disaccharide synthase